MSIEAMAGLVTGREAPTTPHQRRGKSRWALPVVFSSLIAIGVLANPTDVLAYQKSLNAITGCSPMGDEWNSRPHTNVTLMIEGNEDNPPLSVGWATTLTDISARKTIIVDYEKTREWHILGTFHGGADDRNGDGSITFEPGKNYAFTIRATNNPRKVDITQEPVAKAVIQGCSPFGFGPWSWKLWGERK